jgi:hypothetical protein
MAATPIPTPRKLGPSGRALWREISTEYELRADELRLLEDAAREADIIAKLEEGRETADLIVKGSMGQSIIHPVYSELRQHRATLATLLTKLKLADGDSATGAGRTRSTTAREAAASRWSRRGA